MNRNLRFAYVAIVTLLITCFAAPDKAVAAGLSECTINGVKKTIRGVTPIDVGDYYFKLKIQLENSNNYITIEGQRDYHLDPYKTINLANTETRIYPTGSYAAKYTEIMYYKDGKKAFHCWLDPEHTNYARFKSGQLTVCGDPSLRVQTIGISLKGTITDGKNGDGNAYDISMEYKSDIDAPKKPSMTCTVTGTSKISVKWNKVYDYDYVTPADKIQYKLRLEDAYNGNSGESHYLGNNTSYTFENLDANTAYRVKLSAADYCGNISTVEEVITTEKETVPPTLPDDTEIKVSDITKTSALLKWKACRDNETEQNYLRYKVYYREKGKTTWTQSDYLYDTSYTLNGLAEGKTYEVTVHVYDRSNNKADYPKQSFLVPDQTKPTKPSDTKLSFKDITYNAATVSWQAASDNITSVSNMRYKVAWQSASSSSDKGVSGYVTGLTYRIAGLKAQTKYMVMVAAYDEAGLFVQYQTAANAPSFTTTIKTGIEEVTTDNASDNVIYDLHGKKMGHSWDALPNGVYVVNGKKMVKAGR